MPGPKVSVLLVMEEDVENMHDDDGLDIYYVHLSLDTSDSNTLNTAVTRTLLHIHEVYETSGQESATIVVVVLPTNVTRGQVEQATSFATYICTVLKLKDDVKYHPANVNTVQAQTNHVVKAKSPEESIAAARNYPWTTTLTFSASTESYAGMSINGTLLEAGYSAEQLDKFKLAFEQKGCVVEDIRLGHATGTGRAGRVLVVRGALMTGTTQHDGHLVDAVVTDWAWLHPKTDKEAMMRGKLLQRKARYCTQVG
jgi:hypothetical protein